MITDKDLIRRALLGDQEAQAQCTEKGIMLPCPICGGEIKIKQCDWDKFYPYCDGCKFTFDFLFENKEDAIERVNIRPASPIGRCKECKYYTVLWHCEVHSQEPDQYGSGVYVEMLPDDFCSYFEPKKEK